MSDEGLPDYEEAAAMAKACCRGQQLWWYVPLLTMMSATSRQVVHLGRMLDGSGHQLPLLA